LRQLIGGWRDRFAATGALVRPLALSMAATHLRDGRDVILPQYVGSLGEIARFESVADQEQARFREFVLMDTKERSLQRFEERCDNSADPWDRYVSEVVESAGGSALLAQMHDRLSAVIDARSAAVVIASRAEPSKRPIARSSVRWLTETRTELASGRCLSCDRRR
jgi:hypothetical protein